MGIRIVKLPDVGEGIDTFWFYSGDFGIATARFR